ncbi:MAG: ribonuclease III [Clostridiales bacterium]|nr:ribonuclease III [Clostridiales bacterium]
MDDTRKLTHLQSVLQYTFTDTNLLRLAMTHSSYAHEYLADADFYNERIEFLGDAVLELAVSNMLYHTMHGQEGDLSRRRAQIVCEPSLAYVARALDLGEFLNLSRGEDKNGGRQRDSILSDFVEALIGALYLDGGYDAAFRFIDREILSRLKEIEVHTEQDYKTLLQEIVQVDHLSPVYTLIGEDGPPHNRVFTMQVEIDGRVLGTGTGRSKKAAEQHAAQKALEQIDG